MKLWPVIWISPVSLLWLSLVFIVLLLPDKCHVRGGESKKKMGPIKHLFGIGIGYQKVVHWKPVLVFSSKQNNRPKKKKLRSRNRNGWRPRVIVQHHIYQQSQRQSASNQQHMHGNHNPRSHFPRRSHHYHRNGGLHQSYRGWGWKPARKTHYHDDTPIQYHNHQINYSPPTVHSHFVGGGQMDWNAVNPYANVQRDAGVDYVDEDGSYDTAVQETWKWNKHSTPPLAPRNFPETTKSTFPPSESPVTTTDSSLPFPSEPPLYPFEHPPKSDARVTNIRRDFLKNHLQNFGEFQGYQYHHKPSVGFHNVPMMKPPGPNYSTTHEENMANVKNTPDTQHYDDDYYYSNQNDALTPEREVTEDTLPSHNYSYEDDVDDDGFNWSQLNRKMMPTTTSISSSVKQNSFGSTQAPIVYGTPATLSSQQNPSVNGHLQVKNSMNVNGTPPAQYHNLKIFKPSPKIDEIQTSMNDARFFPTFEQFRNIG